MKNLIALLNQILDMIVSICEKIGFGNLVEDFTFRFNAEDFDF